MIGLIELIHPHGSVDSAGSVMHFVSSARSMVRTLADRGFAGGPANYVGLCWSSTGWPHPKEERHTPGRCCKASTRSPEDWQPGCVTSQTGGPTTPSHSGAHFLLTQRTSGPG
jgi:hypothetical protein